MNGSNQRVEVRSRDGIVYEEWRGLGVPLVGERLRLSVPLEGRAEQVLVVRVVEREWDIYPPIGDGRDVDVIARCWVEAEDAAR